MPHTLALIATVLSILALLPLVVFAGYAVSLGFRAGRQRGYHRSGRDTPVAAAEKQ